MDNDRPNTQPPARASQSKPSEGDVAQDEASASHPEHGIDDDPVTAIALKELIDQAASKALSHRTGDEEASHEDPDSVDERLVPGTAQAAEAEAAKWLAQFNLSLPPEPSHRDTDEHNRAQILGSFRPTKPESRTPHAQRMDYLFNAAKDEMLRAARSLSGRGIVVAAVNQETGDLVGSASLRIRAGRAKCLVVGRHPHCRLRLRGDRDVSHRHLALIAWRDGRDVHFRVIDLATRTGILDSRDQKHGALEATGPLFVSVGHFGLFIAPNVDIPPLHAYGAWPQEEWSDAHALAQGIELQGGAPELPLEFGEMGSGVRNDGMMTLVRPVAAPDYVANGGGYRDAPAVAGVHITTDGRHQLLQLSAGQLERGIILGRAKRCEAASLLTDHTISRVHVLMIRLLGVPWIFDLASTNGLIVTHPGHARRETQAARLHAAVDPPPDGQRGTRIKLSAHTVLEWETGL